MPLPSQRLCVLLRGRGRLCGCLDIEICDEVDSGSGISSPSPFIASKCITNASRRSDSVSSTVLPAAIQPACLRMLARVLGFTSIPGLPAIVTFPRFRGVDALPLATLLRNESPPIRFDHLTAISQPFQTLIPRQRRQRKIEPVEVILQIKHLRESRSREPLFFPVAVGALIGDEPIDGAFDRRVAAPKTVIRSIAAS